MILKSRMVFPHLSDFSSFPKHNPSDFVIAFHSINSPSSESYFSDPFKSLQVSVCEVLCQVLHFAFRLVFVVVNFPDAEFLLVQSVKQVCKNLSLVLAVLELSFEIVKLESACAFSFLRLRLRLNFSFSLFFGLDFLFLFFSFRFCFRFILSLCLSLFLIFGKIQLERILSTKEALSEVFGEDRNGSGMIEPSEQVDVLFSLAFRNYQSKNEKNKYLKKFSK